MKNKKVGIGYWIALVFFGYSLFSNLATMNNSNQSMTYAEWLADGAATSSFITLSDVHFNALEAAYIEETNSLSNEVESRLYFIPMSSSTSETNDSDKTKLVYRVSEGEVFDFLEKQLNDSEENILQRMLKNPEAFIFKGPFTGGIQGSNAGMRKIQTEMPNLDKNLILVLTAIGAILIFFK